MPIISLREGIISQLKSRYIVNIIPKVDYNKAKTACPEEFL